MAHYVVLYISGDLDLNLWPILINFFRSQQKDRPDLLSTFQGDYSIIVYARAHTEEQTNIHTNTQTELTNILCENSFAK